jgi:sulfide:quinone oxidoreductase
MERLNVVICGGGVAGVEALLRLRRLAGDHVDVTLVSPDEEFRNRPMAVLEPFAGAGLPRYPVQRIAADAEAIWIKDRVVSVDADACTVRTGGGAAVAYDALLLAIGARESSPFEHAQVFDGRDGGRGFSEIARGIEDGHIGSVAFVFPDGPTWPLPLYELALITASRAGVVGAKVKLAFVTPEVTPLNVLGPQADEAMVRLMGEAGIELHTGVRAQVPSPGEIQLRGTRLTVDRIVTLPAVSPYELPGIPSGTRWFAPIDPCCRVQEIAGHVFAAGDVTDLLVKHGSVGAQQADTAAAGIAYLAGATERPPAPLEPVIRATLLTGDRPLYLAATLTTTRGIHSRIYDQPPWPAGQKIVAEELGPYLARLDSEVLPAGAR